MPLRVTIVGRAGQAELTIAAGMETVRNGYIVAQFTAKAVGDMIQVCLAAGAPLSGDQTLEIDTVAVEAMPEAKPHTVTFEVNAKLDKEHPEVRVRGRATREQPAEEWEQAVARKNGEPRKYWYSKSRDEAGLGSSFWKEPLKYFPVRFKERAKEGDRVAGRTPAQTPTRTPAKTPTKT